MIKIKKLYPDVELPKYGTPLSSGFDLVAHNIKKLYSITGTVHEEFKTLDSIKLKPNERALIGCGFSIEFGPPGEPKEDNS